MFQRLLRFWKVVLYALKLHRQLERLVGFLLRRGRRTRACAPSPRCRTLPPEDPGGQRRSRSQYPQPPPAARADIFGFHFERRAKLASVLIPVVWLFLQTSR